MYVLNITDNYDSFINGIDNENGDIIIILKIFTFINANWVNITMSYWFKYMNNSLTFIT